MAGVKLDDELVIETPERVELYYALASIGNRFLAAFIDHLIQAATITAVMIGVGLLGNWALFSPTSVWGAALGLLGAFGIYWGYFVLFETLWSGQTPGKRIMRLRVIREDGRPVRFFEVLVRNLLRLAVDFFPPPSYAIGVVTIVFSSHSKRVGDFVAGTVVVKERAREAPSLEDIMKVAELESRRLERDSPPPFRVDFRRLSDKELRAVESFLRRRYELAEPNRTVLAARIAGAVTAKLGVTVPELSPEAVLEEIDRQHRSLPYRP